MTEPTDKEQYLNIADQCAATATSALAASILVDGGNGTLRQLLNDAADSIRAGWTTHAQAAPAAVAGPSDEAVPMTDTQPAPVREHALQDVRCACCGYMTYHSEHIGCIRAARAPADSVLVDAARESEYRRGYRHGYEQRDAEVRGALA